MKQQKKHKAPGYAVLLLDTLKVIANRGGSLKGAIAQINAKLKGGGK